MTRFQRLLRVLSASPSRRWCVSFAIIVVLSLTWSLATPLFASPDEPAHVVRAASVARGQLLGRTPPASAHLRGSLLVDVPAIFGTSYNVGCFAFQPDATANCLKFGGSTNERPVLTTAGRHPPLYYATVGWLSVLAPSSFGVRAMRVLTALLAAALLATAVTLILELPGRRLAAVGVAVAVTPMVLFLNGVVNPSAIEIAASICLWVAGTILVLDAPTRIRPSLITATGIAACVLALTRQLGPLWLGITGVVLAWIGGLPAVRALLRSRRFRLWVAAAAACCVAQVVWVASVGTLEASSSQTPGIRNATSSTLFKGSVGRAFVYYRELIGVFGWRDTNPPSLVLVIWTAAIGGVVLLAVLLASRRTTWAIVVIAALTFALPVLFEVLDGRTAGYFWQGRYTIPLAAGIPILAAITSSRNEASSRVNSARLVWVIAVGLGIAQVLAFGQALRRYATGAHGYINFFTGAPWSPPGGAILLTLVFVLGCGAWYAWLFTGDGVAAQPASEAAPSSRA